jgi:hypothetical protein
MKKFSYIIKIFLLVKCLGRDPAGEIMLLDAQAGKGFRGTDAIHEYFESNHVRNVFVLNSVSTQGGQLVLNTSPEINQGETKYDSDGDVKMRRIKKKLLKKK